LRIAKKPKVGMPADTLGYSFGLTGIIPQLAPRTADIFLTWANQKTGWPFKWRWLPVLLGMEK
jgi:hypothetical protein